MPAKDHTKVKPRFVTPGWMDREYLIYHYMFEIVCQFVEKEAGNQYKKKPRKRKDDCFYEHELSWYNAWKELRAIRRWWLKHHDDHKIFEKPVFFEKSDVELMAMKIIYYSHYMWT